MRLAARVFALCFLVFLSIAAFADSLTGKVVRLADGDSITVLDSTNTRAAPGFRASTPLRKASPTAMPQGNIWPHLSQARKSP